jgi:hypothetical protein
MKKKKKSNWDKYGKYLKNFKRYKEGVVISAKGITINDGRNERIFIGYLKSKF